MVRNKDFASSIKRRNKQLFKMQLTNVVRLALAIFVCYVLMNIFRFVGLLSLHLCSLYSGILYVCHLSLCSVHSVHFHSAVSLQVEHFSSFHGVQNVKLVFLRGLIHISTISSNI